MVRGIILKSGIIRTGYGEIHFLEKIQSFARFRIGVRFFIKESRLLALGCHFPLILMFVYTKVPSLIQYTQKWIDDNT
jgi:hypothetical protein